MKRLIPVLMMFAVTNVEASTVTGTIEKMIIGRQGHQVYVHINNAAQTCNADHSLGFNYAISLRDHEAGKEIFSTLIAAQIANKRITIQGTELCTISETMEDISYIYLLN